MLLVTTRRWCSFAVYECMGRKIQVQETVKKILSFAKQFLRPPSKWRPWHVPCLPYPRCATAFETRFIWDHVHLRPRSFETTFIWDHVHLRPRSFETMFIWDHVHLRPFICNHSFATIHLRPHSFETSIIWDHVHLRPRSSESCSFETCSFETTFIWDHIHLRPYSFEITFLLRHVKLKRIKFLWSTFHFFAWKSGVLHGDYSFEVFTPCLFPI